MTTLDQIRAARAYAAIAAASPGAAEIARGLPGILQQNGLLAVWAYSLAKGGDHQTLLLGLLEHLRHLERVEEIPHGPTPKEAFLAWVGNAGAPGLAGRQLRDLTAESLAFAGWLKRAAEAGGTAAGERVGDHG